MKRLVIFLTALALLSPAGALFAQQPDQKETAGTVRSIELPLAVVTLKQGPGVEKTSTLCNICHSLDYITMQPPFPRAQWTATVNKMIKVMGAPVNDEDAKTIIDYLSANYGTGS
jgi:hypothetical protein